MVMRDVSLSMLKPLAMYLRARDQDKSGMRIEDEQAGICEEDEFRHGTILRRTRISDMCQRVERECVWASKEDYCISFSKR
jgi:hypothetical protein